jgi:hypothetical protein
VRAFILSLVALAAITGAAALLLQLVQVASSDVYSDRQSVRL